VKSTAALVTGRLHSIEEWGGKTRIVAILDYWTQALLTPLHNTINHFLRQIPMDGTFDQLSIIAKVQAWTADESKKVYSFDLSAATDRIPILIQRDLLAYLLGSETLADAWRNILVDRDFITEDGTFLRYAVGQPMGAKSSFPMLALIHHVIVQISAAKAQIPSFADYVILGDDNTMANTDVSIHYRDMMASLGVDVNMSKSIVASVGMKSAAEICKRIFIEGRELTSLPVKLIVKCSRFGYMLPSLQNTLYQRGTPITGSNLFKFFMGISDSRSVLTLIMLNKVPTAVSGLANREPVDQRLDYAKWFKNLVLNDAQIEQAYIYTLVTEQLKRVDALLRGTIQMNEIIVGLATQGDDKAWPPGFFLGMTEADRITAAAKLPKLTLDHPMCHAAHDEMERVVSYLSGLRAGSPEMVSAARHGLLDLLRNSLSEILFSDDEGGSSVTRSLFNVMLSTLGNLNRRVGVKSSDNTLNFSILLTHVGRMWSVSWTFGKNVHINVVKSRVDSSVQSVSNRLDSALDNVNIANLRF
jgi:hypothetical protein